MRTAHRRPRLVTAALLTLLTVVALAAPAAAPASAATRGTRAVVGTHYALFRPVCATDTPRHCLAVRRVPATSRTPGARAYRVDAAYPTGLAGGYTPADLASAYGFDPTTPSKVTVAVVLWYDNPNAASDLATFDEQYGIRVDGQNVGETATSFRKVDQDGGTTYPKADVETTGEQSLDIQTIRSVCNSCNILAVEPNSPDDADIAAAENTAVRLGATVVSNSWGGSEQATPSPELVASFNHPGVAVVASSGDDGWYDWDTAVSDGDDPSARQAAEYPASDPHVISVGGTRLTLTSNGARAAETVWNSPGQEADGTSLGASGSGCSRLFAARYWQVATAGRAAARCGMRLSNDIAAVGDPETGFDVYSTYGATPADYWATTGGTSLSAPLIGGLIALAGGPQGVPDPASTLYANLLHHPTSRYDVTSGGNGYCGGEAVKTCSDSTQDKFGTFNPNLLADQNGTALGLLDCSFSDTEDATPTSQSTACNAAPGFDGPSGVGTPNGLGLFVPVKPTPTLTATAARTTANVTVGSPSAVPGGGGSRFVWSFGDKTYSTGTSPHFQHHYAAAGTYRVTVQVTDAQGLTGTTAGTVAVGYYPTVKVTAPASITHGRAAAFSIVGSRSRNSGGHIYTTLWSWGDGTSVRGSSPTHTWRKAGSYGVTTTVTDTTGVSVTTRRRVSVR